MTRVLVIGASGVFGRLLGEGLSRIDGVELVLAGRNLERLEETARALASTVPGLACETLSLDVAKITPADIEKTGAAIVIDAAGPYQGAAPRVAEAAIAARCHYADLADGRDFVAAFPALDEAARRAGVAALTGASSTPALSNAAIDALTAGWRRIDTIRVGIAPGNRAPRGLSVVSAVLSWVGAPLQVFDGGRWLSEAGWSRTRPAPIGNLGPRPLALAEAPDLDILVARHRPTWRARFEAGLELGVLHYGLAAAGWLRRLGLIKSLRGFAAPARWAAERLYAFGSDRGGMIVEVAGRDGEDRPRLARWTLIAEAGDGPHIPTLPAVALVRKLVGGARLEPGARACVGVLSLDEIEAEMAHLKIATERSEVALRSVFEQALGERLEAAPPAVRAVHCGGPVTRLAGRAAVEGARTLAGRLFSRACGLPRASEACEVAITMEVAGDGSEVWQRNFGGHDFQTRLTSPGPGRFADALGPLAADCAIEVSGDGISIDGRGARLFGMALPRFLAPGCEAREYVDAEGRFSFDVAISVPVLGRLVRYRGRLEPVGQT